jgi:hypothetical protein
MGWASFGPQSLKKICVPSLVVIIGVPLLRVFGYKVVEAIILYALEPVSQLRPTLSRPPERLLQTRLRALTRVPSFIKPEVWKLIY